MILTFVKGLWAKKPFRSLVYALGALGILLPFARPFLLGKHPASGDGLINLYRVVALDYAIQHGDLWPRFLSAMHYGFGGPSFNFYSPLSLYLIESIHLLGVALPLAYRLGVVLIGLIAMYGMFLWARRWAGPLAGVVAATAYLYAPPFFTTFDRPAQLLAVALLPWLMWALERAAESAHARDMAVLAGLFSGLLLTHNVTALYAAPMVAAYALFLIATADDRRRVAVAVGMPIVAGVWLATFFWLPALAEQQYVQLSRLDTAQFDYHAHFLPLTQVFPFDLPQSIALGWPQIVLAGAGIAVGRRSERLARSVFAVGMIAVLVFFTLRASVWVWDHVPVVELLLFPQRLLYGAGLWLALLAGQGAAWLLSRRNSFLWRGVVVFAAIVGLIVYTLPTLNTAYLDEPPAAESVVDLHAFERNTGWLGATSAGEFLPVWVREEPDVWALVDRFKEADVIDRLQANPDVQIVEADWQPKRVSMTIDAQVDTILIFEWFYFPGWAASIDGEPVVLLPPEGDGLVRMAAPQGIHDVEVAFHATPVRRLAEWMSLVGLIAFGIGLVWWHDRTAMKASSSSPVTSH